MPFTEYAQFDAIGLAELVRHGEVSARELLDEGIKRRDAVNGKLNAVVHNMDEIAYRSIEDGLPDGPFSGVPFLLKDLLSAYKGVPMSNGCRAYKDYIPDYDSELVQRFKRAGLVVFGKTNCPENGYLGTTQPLLHGITRNPWDLDRTAGGSSGGSGAAVAARIVPMASGGDGGGSLRIPGSCCGVVGFKPSSGRNPQGPVGDNPWYGQVQEGVISISVRDTAAVLDATHGAALGDATVIPAPQRPFLEELSQPAKKLKIAWSAAPLMREGALGQECVEALKRTVEKLKDLGHELIEATPPTDPLLLGQGYIVRMMSSAAVDIRMAKRTLGRRMTAHDFEPETWLMARSGEALSAAMLETVRRDFDQQKRIYECFMQDYDVFLTPTLSKPPVEHGEYLLQGAEKVISRIAQYVSLSPILRIALPSMLPELQKKNFDWVASTSLANITGNPSVSLPLEWSRDGLPIGMMFSARYLDDACLFRLSAQLEREFPWFDKRPTHCAN